MSKRWAACKSRGWWECQPIKSGGEWDESGATGQAAACYCPLRCVLIPRSFPSVREPEDSGATLGCGVWVSPGWPWGPRRWGWGLVAKGTFFVPEAQYLCNVVVEDSVVFKCWPGYLSLLLGPSNMNDFEVSPSLVNSIFHYWDHFKLKLYNLLIQVRAKLQWIIQTSTNYLVKLFFSSKPCCAIDDLWMGGIQTLRHETKNQFFI